MQRISGGPAWRAAWLALVLLPGASRAADDLARSRTIFQQQLQSIRQETDAARNDLLGQYRRALDGQRQAAKQKGDLDAVQAADREIERFEKEKRLPATPATSADPDVARLITACRDALDKAELGRAHKIVQLADQYAQFLDQRMKQAVREDRIDAAKECRQEIEAVRQVPDYQAAKFLLGEKESQAEPPKVDAPATNAAPPVAAPAEPVERVRPRVDPEDLYDAARIFEGLPSALLTQPSPYRQLMVTETGKAPMSGGIGLALDGWLDADNARYQLRVKLRSKTAGATIQNLKVLAQYFVRSPNGGAIQETRTAFAPVSNVTPRQATCEFKPVDLPYSYVYRLRGFSIVEDREGAFCGVVVSVFGEGDKLLAQVASATRVKEQGRTAFEMPRQWTERERVVEYGPIGPDGRPRYRRIIHMPN
jgi:hypothetical protein